MIDFAVDNPEITSAIIAALVALLVAATTGFYTLRIANKKIDLLKEEVIAQELSKGAAQRFMVSHDEFVLNYREYEQVLQNLADVEDGIPSVQHVVDFVASHVKPMIVRFTDFLGPEVKELETRFDKAAEKCSKKFDPSDPTTHSLAIELRQKGIALAARVNEVRPR